jgi:hypothetical protein
MRILKAAEDIVRDRLRRPGRTALDQVLSRTMARDIDPYAAARVLLETVADKDRP